MRIGWKGGPFDAQPSAGQKLDRFVNWVQRISRSKKKIPFLYKSLLLENATKLERSIRSEAHMLLILPICVQGLRHTSVCSPVSVTEGSLHAVDPATTRTTWPRHFRPISEDKRARSSKDHRRKEEQKASINIMSMWMNEPTDDDGGETKAGS